MQAKIAKQIISGILRHIVAALLPRREYLILIGLSCRPFAPETLPHHMLESYQPCPVPRLVVMKARLYLRFCGTMSLEQSHRDA